MYTIQQLFNELKNCAFITTTEFQSICITSRRNLIMMHRCRFISCIKCPTMGEDVDNGRTVHVLRWDIYGESLYPRFNFAVNLKLL